MKKIKASNSNNYAYNPTLQKHALALRNDMTRAKAYLWNDDFKAPQKRGYQFRRQRPVLNYLADFLSKDLMLIMEHVFHPLATAPAFTHPPPAGDMQFLFFVNW